MVKDIKCRIRDTWIRHTLKRSFMILHCDEFIAAYLSVVSNQSTTSVAIMGIAMYRALLRGFRVCTWNLLIEFLYGDNFVFYKDFFCGVSIKYLHMKYTFCLCSEIIKGRATFLNCYIMQCILVPDQIWVEAFFLYR